MKITMIISFALGMLMFSGHAMAEGEMSTIENSKEQKQSKEKVQKKRRRKKALMCNECGKPEVECECEGHGEEGHDDH